jgi:hypothetical protein
MARRSPAVPVNFLSSIFVQWCDVRNKAAKSGQFEDLVASMVDPRRYS